MPRPLFLLAVLATAALATAPTGSAQPAPAVDFASLLDTRFFPQRGEFLYGTPRDFLIFPPAGLDRYDVEGAYLVRDANGQVIGQQRWGTLEPTGSAAFLTIGTRSGPEWNGPLQSGGRYTLDLVLDRQVVGSVPFMVTVSEGDDPFDPQTIYALDGPWRTHSYFEYETDQPDYRLWYNAWIAPGETRDNASTEVSLQRGGEEIAWGSAFVDFQHGWKRAEYVLYTPDSRPDEDGRRPNRTLFTIRDVTPGPYAMVFSDADGREFRRVALEGGAGAFPDHPRSAVDYEPRSQFLSSRALGGSTLSKSLTRHWIVAE